MPSQLSTIMYISDYQEKTSNNFFIGTAIGHTRLEEDSDAVQTFNITVFYPLDGRPTYVPKIKEGQVLSVSNSKFTKGDNNRIDVTLYLSAFNFFSLLNIILTSFLLSFLFSYS